MKKKRGKGYGRETGRKRYAVNARESRFTAHPAWNDKSPANISFHGRLAYRSVPIPYRRRIVSAGRGATRCHF
ncbi:MULTISPECIES: hypothetical protein [Bacteroidales]|nr:MULTISPECIES: hypothetical protein [Bacteroidales]MDB0672194.1 hypothetical protein [Barnesiella intestinihominis]